MFLQTFRQSFLASWGSEGCLLLIRYGIHRYVVIIINLYIATTLDRNTLLIIFDELDLIDVPTTIIFIFVSLTI